MPDEPPGPVVLPYSCLVGQDALRRALELAFVAPAIGGVLASGVRGTAKSTTVRAFAQAVLDDLPVTLPINATDDRVLGGWLVESLLEGGGRQQAGLLERAHRGLLYIDEVNLLDDYVVNIILDVLSTGVLEIQREGLDRRLVNLSFTLVGTMNPEEGGLRPQLLDRFGLLVRVSAESAVEQRLAILQTVLRFDEERRRPGSAWLAAGRERDRNHRAALLAARERLRQDRVAMPEPMVRLCAELAAELEADGHRGEIVTALAARANAALAGRDAVVPDDVAEVVPMSLVHRRVGASYEADVEWSVKEQEITERVIAGYRTVA
ncbi:AAA family ATPase [Paractinoplanes rishiriensis]|uniref:Magnesium chelatase n=1 Tax=Paractinoplanes rishiriensis TaxID=1050105 RepID=A0A919MXS0_9ACTN|nr:AAA family ATPase [Actinoplanes rishiriensis]GIE98934.1 magnesium chelatase [Actinoplanes rishiriensis]